MGGFQKYPIPRFLYTGSWVVNKYWKRNVFHVLVPSAFMAYFLRRHMYISSVKTIIFSSIVISIPFSIKACQLEPTWTQKATMPQSSSSFNSFIRHFGAYCIFYEHSSIFLTIRQLSILDTDLCAFMIHTIRL